jgi:hypothetical protein
VPRSRYNRGINLPVIPGLRGRAVDVVVLTVELLIGIVVYMLPSIISANRNHPHMFAIAWLNILAGWTFVGWVGAMVWACIDLSRMRESGQAKVSAPTQPSDSN